MLIHFVCLFPDEIRSYLNHSMMWKAQEIGAVRFVYWDLREFGLGVRRQVDDRPYGGGAGMVLRPEPLVGAIEEAQKYNVADGQDSRVVLLTPQGQLYNQKKAIEYSRLGQEEISFIFVCGHYEGVDERVREGWVDEEISIGDYVLTEGEIGALVLTDSIVRLLPGVLGDERSLVEESHVQSILEYPHYTRPEVFRGYNVPGVLLSGHHKVIEKWRQEESLKRTRSRRPDLFLNKED